MSRERTRTIAALALPIIGGMVSQNVLNLVDTAMVGTLGDAAIAAVGLGSFAYFVLFAALTGVSVGVQAMAARRLGEGRGDQSAVPLNGGLLLVLAVAAPATVALWFAAPAIFRALNDDPEVIAVGGPFLQARVLGMVGLGMNYAFRGFWSGIGLAKTYLRALLLMHTVNIGLNWVLIFGHLGSPAFGAVGSGIATTIATYVGTAYYLAECVRDARGQGFLKALPDRSGLATLVRLAVPSGVQQVAFAAGFTALFWIVGRVGTTELAAANVVLNVTLVAILPGLGLGIAAASLVGQALGRADVEDARRWGWDVARVGVVVMGALGVPMALAPDLVLGAFLHDPGTLAVARGPLRLVGVMIWADAVAMVLMNALLGAGDSRRVMVASIGLQWGLFLPVAWLLGPVLGHGLMAIWSAQVAYRVLSALVFGALWQRGRWASIRV